MKSLANILPLQWEFLHIETVPRKLLFDHLINGPPTSNLDHQAINHGWSIGPPRIFNFGQHCTALLPTPPPLHVKPSTKLEWSHIKVHVWSTMLRKGKFNEHPCIHSGEVPYQCVSPRLYNILLFFAHFDLFSHEYATMTLHWYGFSQVWMDSNKLVITSKK